jgi:hypothetical protein
MDPSLFITVLGHPRILAGSLPDARRRVLAYDGETVVGVATYEPLFGHQAEAAIANADDAATGLVSFLLDGLLELAAGAGVTVLRFVFATSGQRGVAVRLAADRRSFRVLPDRLEIRFAPLQVAALEPFASRSFSY